MSVERETLKTSNYRRQERRDKGKKEGRERRKEGREGRREKARSQHLCMGSMHENSLRVGRNIQKSFRRTWNSPLS